MSSGTVVIKVEVDLLDGGTVAGEGDKGWAVTEGIITGEQTGTEEEAVLLSEVVTEGVEAGRTGAGADEAGRTGSTGRTGAGEDERTGAGEDGRSILTRLGG